MPPRTAKPRRALLTGPAFHGYNQSIARGLRQAGFDTHIIESPRHNPTGLVNRARIDLAGQLGITRFGAEWAGAFNERLLASYRALQPEPVLIIKGRWILPSTVEAMKGSVRAIWFQDAVHRCTVDFAELSRAVDHVFVFEGSDVDALRDQHRITSHFLPLGFCPETYHPLPGVDQDIDISFVGFPYANRVAIFERLIDDFPGLRIRIYGRYVRYRETSSWRTYAKRLMDPTRRKTYRNRELAPEEVNRIYARSRIVLNIHNQQSHKGCNPRVFELIGAGACQLVDANAYLRAQLSDTLTMYSDYDELRAQVARYLGDEAERQAAASRAYAARDAHTFERRIRDLLQLSGLS